MRLGHIVSPIFPLVDLCAPRALNRDWHFWDAIATSAGVFVISGLADGLPVAPCDGRRDLAPGVGFAGVARAASHSAVTALRPRLVSISVGGGSHPLTGCCLLVAGSRRLFRRSFAARVSIARSFAGPTPFLLITTGLVAFNSLSGRILAYLSLCRLRDDPAISGAIKQSTCLGLKLRLPFRQYL